MRIGTWNLAGRWTAAHCALLLEQGCDVWLLTEVREDVVLAGFQRHLTTCLMVEQAPSRHWAGVLSREPLDPLPDPHPASALATVDGVTYCSSILPWRTAGSATPWIGDTTASRMADLPHQRESLATIDHIAVARHLVVKAERQSAGGLSDHDLYIVEI